MGRKLATGGFGTVYKATLREDDQPRPVIIKKATEFGEAEVRVGGGGLGDLGVAEERVAGRASA